MSPQSLLAFALLFATTGCMSPPPTRLVEGRLADVRARDLDLALRVAGDADRALEWIRSVCPDTRAARPEVWVVERIAPLRGFPLSENTDGLHLDFLWIERIYLTETAESGALAHELGHFLLGSDWKPLPPFVEEGLANWFLIHQPGVLGEDRRRQLRAAAALALGGEIELRALGDAGLRLRFSSGLPSLEQIARHSSSALVFEDVEQRLAAHAHGYVLAERVIERGGLEGLLALCQRASKERRARVPVEWLYAASGIESAEAMGRELLRSMQPDELATLVRILGESILRLLSKEHGFAWTSPDFARWLKEAKPVVALPGSELSLPLMQVEGVAEVFAAARARAAARLSEGE